MPKCDFKVEAGDEKKKSEGVKQCIDDRLSCLAFTILIAPDVPTLYIFVYTLLLEINTVH